MIFFFSGTQGLGGMVYVIKCLTEKYEPTNITWQWLLGRLYVIEKLVVEFPTEFLPRQRPDGASSESSLEMIGAASSIEEERPQNYDRLLIVAEFAIKAVSNCHARISRVAKRVFLLSAKYAVHLENMISEFKSLLTDLEFTHKKSLQRQLDKIVSDFQLADELGKQLCDQFSPPDTPDLTPISTPRCTSPVTVISDTQSDTYSSKIHPVVPPNTPIHERRKQMYSGKNKSFDTFSGDVEISTGMKSSKSLDALDTDCRPRSRQSKSPVMKKCKSRSRSNTPQRIGPVLETNIDEVIKMQEEARKKNSSKASLDNGCESVFTDTNDFDDDSVTLNVQQDRTDFTAPPSRLLSNDLETDIDSVEPDLNTLLMVGNTGPWLTPKLDKNEKLVPNTLNLNFGDSIKTETSKRSISPCAHVKELERLSVLGNVSQAPCINSLTQTNSAFATEALDTKLKNYSTASTVAVRQTDVSSKPSNKLTVSCGQRPQTEVSNKTDMTDDLTDYRSPVGKHEKPVTFVSEVASATPKHSPSHTLDKGKERGIQELVKIFRINIFLLLNNVLLPIKL